MITTKQARSLKRAIQRVVKAEVDYSWRGGGDPDDLSEIEEQHEEAYRSLNRALAKLQSPE